MLRVPFDEVWILSVEGTQLSLIPLLEDTTSLCMVRCGACHNASDAQVRNKRIQYAKIKNVNDSSLLDISLIWSVFLLPSLVAARGRLYMLFWVLAIVIGIYSFG